MTRSRTSAAVRVLATFLVALVVAFCAAGATPGNAAALDQPNYASDVAPILNRQCVTCHRPGQIGPMSLRTYDEVRPWAKSIAKNVADGLMPPWHAESALLKFANDRRLSSADRETIVRWVAAGAPAGNLAEAPAPPVFPSSEWRLGEPDFVATLDEVVVPAGGPDVFRNLVGKVALPDDKWVTAVEILPGNSTVVHHVIAIAVKGFDVDPQEGWLGAWAAGTDPMVFPKGTGRLLPKGSNVIADMHFHPTDSEQKDTTRVGLHFAKEGEIDRALANIWIMNEGFEIPAGAKGHEVRASRTFWEDGKILSLIPHMHFRGTDFTFLAHYLDGRTETLMTVPRWDFNWQTVYELSPPLEVRGGTRIEVIAHFDNSTDNPVNPDPTKAVRFGNESFNEMMIGFVDFVAKDNLWPQTPHQIRTRKLAELAKQFPGQVYALSGKKPEDRSQPDSWAPLVLPRQGDGQYWIIWNNQLEASRVHDVVWDGDRYQAKVESPYGDFGLHGEITDGKKITAVLVYPNGRESAWDGELVGW